MEQKLYTSINEFKRSLINNEPINELFGGLRDKLKNSFSKMIGGSVAKIDKVLDTYKNEYSKLIEEQTAVIQQLEDEDSEDLVKNRLYKLDVSLEKKKQLITQKLHNGLKPVIKNDREQTYADLQENSIKLELVNMEIEMLSKLKVKTDMSKKLDKLKKDTQKQIKSDNSKLKNLVSDHKSKDTEELTVGQPVKYIRKNGEEVENILTKINKDTITIKTKNGKTFDIPKKQIIK